MDTGVMNTYPQVRLRRYRRSEALRRMFDTPLPAPSQFIWPVFVVDGQRRKEPIAALPGQCRYSPDLLLKAIEPVARMGVGGVLLFGVIGDAHKNATGSAAGSERGVVQRAVRAIRREFPGVVIVTDVCLCAYTSHGHCGPLDADGQVDNDKANALLARVAVSHAAAGADIVAPSAMMDGQVKGIRAALDAAGFSRTLLMSYSTKFASAFYGPFREAEKSAPKQGHRRGYQASFRNLKLALRESALDEAEGADILMVKPALLYLDVIARLRQRTDLPIAAYNVSGEYAMLAACADRGWGNLKDMVRESTAAIGRAGADLIISYWSDRYSEFFAHGQG